LRHQNNQRSLTKIRGFASHVWAGDEKQLLAARFKAEIVQDKTLTALAKKLFDNRMASANDKHLAGGIEFGASIAAVGRKLSESGEDIKLSYCRSRASQARSLGGNG